MLTTSNTIYRFVKILGIADLAYIVRKMRKRQRADIHRDIWRGRSCLGESILPATPIAQPVMATATATTT